MVRSILVTALVAGFAAKASGQAMDLDHARLSGLRPAQPLATCNSAESDYAPAYDPLTRTLVFTSERGGTACVYRCAMNSEGAAQRVAGTFNCDGEQRAFVALTDAGDGVGVAYATYDAQAYAGIVTVPREGADLNMGHAITAINGPFFVSHPAIAPDGSRIVFASTRPGGEGGVDLWVSELREDRTWSVPVNLGSTVNTGDDEITPSFASADTLLYATNGQGGLGGFDIFMTVYRNGAWQEPLPLDWLNSEFDDSDGIILPDGSYVFASTRPGGAGGLDLWIMRKP